MSRLIVFGLYALGAIIGFLGLVIIFILRGAVPLLLGLGFVLAGAYILKNANIRRRKRAPYNSVKKVTSRKSKGPGKIALAVAFISLTSTLVFFGIAFEDLRTGHDQVWPVYAIAISGQISAIVFAHICGVYGRNLFK